MSTSERTPASGPSPAMSEWIRERIAQIRREPVPEGIARDEHGWNKPETEEQPQARIARFEAGMEALRAIPDDPDEPDWEWDDESRSAIVPGSTIVSISNEAMVHDSPEFIAWFWGLVEREGLPTSSVLEKALALYAQSVGYAPPPPRR